ncbi:hypothetical protein ScPMuIL_009757 [Solemya velum]
MRKIRFWTRSGRTGNRAGRISHLHDDGNNATFTIPFTHATTVTHAQVATAAATKENQTADHLFTMMPFDIKQPARGVTEATVKEREESVPFVIEHQQPVVDVQMPDIYNTRLDRLNEACKHTDYTARLRPSQHSITNIIVDEKYSFMYCRNKKVGTSFWSRMANAISGRKKYYRVIKLDDYNDKKDILQNLAIRFMFVRNPYERAMSAYIHKFLTPLVTSWITDGQYIERVIRDAEHILGLLNRKHNLNLIYEDYIDEDSWSWTDLTVKTMFRNQKFIEKCMPFHEAMRRVWRNFQIRGFIGMNVSLPFGPGDPVTSRTYLEAFGEAKRTSGGDAYRKRNKGEAMLEAYSMVPMEDLEKLSQAFKIDCDFFGYDCRPPDIFNRPYIKPLQYFNI